jgi:hypothetical protein
MRNKLSVYLIDIDSARRKSCGSNLLTTLFDEVVDRNTADIICAHANDLNGKNRDKSKTKYREVNPGKLIILYSGGGCDQISQNDLDSKQVLMIGRSVSNKESAITKDEWAKIHELIDWETKTFIRSTLECGCILPALSILCQCYLTAYANTEFLTSDIEEVLVLMRNDPIAPSKEIDLNLINNLDWWKNCFRDEDIKLTPSPTSSSKEQIDLPSITGKITCEWKASNLNDSRLAELLREIYGDGTISLQKVAGAYCEIVKQSLH